MGKQKKKKAGRELDERATSELRNQLENHLTKKKCFNKCPTEELEISHIYKKSNGKWTTNKEGNVRTLCRFYVKETRNQKFETKIMSEALKCGLLCHECHRLYDNHYLHGHDKAPFDDEYRKHGAAAAGWQQWKSDYLTRSASFDSKFAKLPA